jgi:hypothetical protein
MDNTKTCSFCDNPLHLTLLGPKRVPVWVHKGVELDTCQALKLNKNLMQSLHQVLENISKVSPVRVERNEKGEPVIFGEKRTTQS